MSEEKKEMATEEIITEEKEEVESATDQILVDQNTESTATVNEVQPSKQSTAENEEGSFRDIWKEIRVWVRDLLFAAIVCIMVIVYIVQPFRVEKTSMEPLLKDGDRIIVSKIHMLFEPIDRGDVVVLWNPRNPEESWIKRVIGLPGETVQIIDGYIYINGVQIDEPYIPDDERNPPKNSFPSRNAQWLTRNYPERMEEFGYIMLDDYDIYPGTDVALRVPNGYYFVCGDHRRYSMDSRDSVFPFEENGPGLIPAKYIYGKAMLRYWPIDKFGFIEHPTYEKRSDQRYSGRNE